MLYEYVTSLTACIVDGLLEIYEGIILSLHFFGSGNWQIFAYSSITQL